VNTARTLLPHDPGTGGSEQRGENLSGGIELVGIADLIGCDGRDAAVADADQLLRDLRGRADHGDVLRAAGEGSPPYMMKVSATSSRALSMSSVTQTGMAAATRGRARPAASAARLMEGTMWAANVFGPTIQVTVPSATVPASSSILGPSAATSTCGAGAATSTEPCEMTVSPSSDDGSPESIGSNAARYSRMCRSGLS
jgi:hypothetical protein